MASKFLGDRSKKYSRLDKLYESQSSWIPETNEIIICTIMIYTYLGRYHLGYMIELLQNSRLGSKLSTILSYSGNHVKKFDIKTTSNQNKANILIILLQL